MTPIINNVFSSASIDNGLSIINDSMTQKLNSLQQVIAVVAFASLSFLIIALYMTYHSLLARKKIVKKEESTVPLPATVDSKVDLNQMSSPQENEKKVESATESPLMSPEKLVVPQDEPQNKVEEKEAKEVLFALDIHAMAGNPRPLEERSPPSTPSFRHQTKESIEKETDNRESSPLLEEPAPEEAESQISMTQALPLRFKLPAIVEDAKERLPQGSPPPLSMTQSVPLSFVRPPFDEEGNLQQPLLQSPARHHNLTASVPVTPYPLKTPIRIKPEILKLQAQLGLFTNRAQTERISEQDTEQQKKEHLPEPTPEDKKKALPTFSRPHAPQGRKAPARKAHKG